MFYLSIGSRFGVLYRVIVHERILESIRLASFDCAALLCKL